MKDTIRATVFLLLPMALIATFSRRLALFCYIGPRAFDLRTAYLDAALEFARLDALENFLDPSVVVELLFMKGQLNKDSVTNHEFAKFDLKNYINVLSYFIYNNRERARLIWNWSTTEKQIAAMLYAPAVVRSLSTLKDMYSNHDLIITVYDHTTPFKKGERLMVKNILKKMYPDYEFPE